MSIVKFIKQVNQAAHDTLYDKVKKQLSTQSYMLTPAVFKKAIDSLLEKAYLQRVMSRDNKEQCYKYLE